MTQNVKMHVEEGKLILEIDITQKVYDTNKAEMVGTSGGWVALHDLGHGELALNINVTRKRGGQKFHQKSGVA